MKPELKNLLIKVRDHIVDENVFFDMSDFGYTSDAAKTNNKFVDQEYLSKPNIPECGSPACIVGWMAHMELPKDHELFVKYEWFRSDIYMLEDTDLGLTLNEIDHIAYAHWHPLGNPDLATRNDAVAYLNKAIEKENIIVYLAESEVDEFKV